MKMSRRAPVLLLPLALAALAGCQDRELPTALAPEDASFAAFSVGCDADAEVRVAALIQAIADANANPDADVIDLAPGCTYTLTSAADLALGLPEISGDLTINGNGATIERSSEADAFRMIQIASGATVSIFRLTISGGQNAHVGGILNRGTLTLTHSTVSGNDGGGIKNEDGTLTLEHSTVSGNSATSAAGIRNDRGTMTITHSTVSGNTATADFAAGGGIINFQGTLTITHSTVSGNSATGEFAHGGGIVNRGTLTLMNSTVSGNTAQRAAGGIYNNGSMTLTHSTVAYNSANQGGGIEDEESSTGRTLKNTIIAHNTASSNPNCWYYYSLTDGGYNLSDDNSCGFDAATSLSNTDPQLGPLQVHAPGTTATHALLPGSPAIDAIPDGENGCGTTYTTDQRGVARPQGSACDIGAYEREPEAGFTFAGFFAPVDNGVLNVVKAGQAIPVKFSLGGDHGLNVFETGYPRSQPIACDASAPQDPVSETVTAGSSSLSYDASTGRYTYVWKTEKSWGNSCRRLTLLFSDGTTRTADFRFTK